jgi:hypothetical protein
MGLVITCSCSGTTTPDAEIEAITGPFSTSAVSRSYLLIAGVTKFLKPKNAKPKMVIIIPSLQVAFLYISLFCCGG